MPVPRSLDPRSRAKSRASSSRAGDQSDPWSTYRPSDRNAKGLKKVASAGRCTVTQLLFLFVLLVGVGTLARSYLYVRNATMLHTRATDVQQPTDYHHPHTHMEHPMKSRTVR
mmetsp:Transcript_8043/g.19188  ORF Transcript_8043/g.19188 Transcript_8043/m.19188 type:complete len:113 (-) Transcript_8043:181-519(-)|eukprot:6507804-Prymnesium_polylepis.3